MKIILMSDSHGNKAALEKIFLKTKGSGNIFVHLGDGERELDYMRTLYPSLDIRHVSGNCDYNSMSPVFDVIACGDTKILVTHGHRYNVKYGTETIRSVAQNFGCRVAAFGHTHCRFQSYEDGIHILNPGSCSCPRDFSRPSFGFIDITPQGIFTGISEV